MGPGLLATIGHRADRTAQWAAVGLGFSIPLFTALDSFLLLFVVTGWLASGAWREKWDAIGGNRVALAALALFGLFLVGTLYGERNPGDTAVTLRKYLDLLWISILIWVFRDPAMRLRALYALAASLALVLLMSFLIMADVIPKFDFFTSSSSSINPVVFKGRQTHGPLMALGAFLYTQFALTAVTTRARVLWLALAVLAVINGTLVVQGATGYLIFGTLALYLGYLWKGWRGIAWAAGTAAALVATLMIVPAPFKERVFRVQDEIAQWRPGVADETSSVGTRIEFYRLSLEIVTDRPLFGHGTGSFTRAYAEKTKGQAAVPTRNPHNEYLHIMAQFGVIGLAALFWLFATHWRLAPDLASPLEHHVARALVLTIAVACLFNSWLLDHTEGLLYAWLTGVLFAGLKPPGRT